MVDWHRRSPGHRQDNPNFSHTEIRTRDALKVRSEQHAIGTLCNKVHRFADRDLQPARVDQLPSSGRYPLPGLRRVHPARLSRDGRVEQSGAARHWPHVRDPARHPGRWSFRLQRGRQRALVLDHATEVRSLASARLRQSRSPTAALRHSRKNAAERRLLAELSRSVGRRGRPIQLTRLVSFSGERGQAVGALHSIHSCWHRTSGLNGVTK